MTVAERVAVVRQEDVAVATSTAVRTAHAAGVAALDAVRLVAAELAENLHRHAGGGELVLVPPWAGLADADGGPFGVYAIDRFGVEHFDLCLVDGFSTTGTLGTGLGAVRRMSDDFDAVSEPGRGTVVRAAFSTGRPLRPDPHFTVGAFGLPVEGQSVNGDDIAVARRGSRLVVLAADGLGHGPSAADASTAAVRAFGLVVDAAPAAIVTAISHHLVASRGAAIAVAELDLEVARDGGRMPSAGLGNVALVVAGPDGTTHRIMTSHGTAGVRTPRQLTEQRSPFPAHGVLVLHTDGLTSRWTFEGRTELLRHAPDVIAAALWRDHSRGSDDSLVVVVRARPRGAST